MDQDRRDAQAWAQSWAVKQRNRKIIAAVVAVALLIVFIYAIKYITIITTRSTYASEEEMRAALQGRFVYDDYEDIVIQGDDVTLTYYERSHYNLEYAKQYGYSEYEDSVYDDVVEEWDYKHGVIKMRWMSDITVDKKGRLNYYSQDFRWTDEEHEEPFDKSLLYEDSSNSTDWTDEETEETEEAVEEQQESLDQTQEMQEQASAAGIVD